MDMLNEMNRCGRQFKGKPDGEICVEIIEDFSSFWGMFIEKGIYWGEN
jgi:hypothetical protein